MEEAECDCLGEELKEQQVQRPWGRKELGVLEDQMEGPGSCTLEGEGRE